MSLIRIKRSFTDFIQMTKKKTKNTKANKSMNDITSFSSAAPKGPRDTTLTSPTIDDKAYINDLFQAYHEPSVLDVRCAIKYGLDKAPGSLVKITFPRASSIREVTLEVLNRSDDLCLVPRTPLLPSTPIFEDSLTISLDSPASPCTPSLICSTPDLSVVQSNTRRTIKIEDFQLLQFLSKGAWGQVYLAKDIVTNKRVAVKVMKRSEKIFTIPIARKMLIQERNIMASLQGSEWFVQLGASWCDSNNLYLAMTYYPTDLDSEIIRCERLSMKRARFYMAEIIIALEELHNRGIVHRDIKAANILIRADGHIVLADFGFSKDFGRKPTIAERSYQPYWPFKTEDDVFNVPRRSPAELTFVADEMLGSELGMAPEIVLQEFYSFGVDFWAAGVTLYLMLTGRHPWSEEKEKSIQLQILEDEVEFEVEDEVSEECQDFIRQLLRKEPEERLRIGLDMTSHPYFAGLDWVAMRNKEVRSPWVPEFVSGHYFYEDWESLEMFEPGHILENDEDDVHEFFFISPEMEQCVETPLEGFFRWGPEDEVDEDDDEELWSPDLGDEWMSSDIDHPYRHVKVQTPVISKSDTLASMSTSLHSMSSLQLPLLVVLDVQATTFDVVGTETEIEKAQSDDQMLSSIPFVGPAVFKCTTLTTASISGCFEQPIPSSESKYRPIAGINGKDKKGRRRTGLIKKVSRWLNGIVRQTVETVPVAAATNATSDDISIFDKIKGIFKKIFGHRA